MQTESYAALSSEFLILSVASVSSRVSTADQMVPGLAALRPAHPGADLRPPLDEGNDRVPQVTGGASRW